MPNYDAAFEIAKNMNAAISDESGSKKDNKKGKKQNKKQKKLSYVIILDKDCYRKVSIQKNEKVRFLFIFFDVHEKLHEDMMKNMSDA